MSDLKLTDLIDVTTLQKIQDGFSEYTGMAALITDATGTPVTIGSGFTDFCQKLTRQSVLGRKRCEECDKLGALQTLKDGKPAVYDCHAGLVDFAAPIMLKGEFIGSIIGGQIRTNEMSEEQVRNTAIELGIDENIYLEAARKVYIIRRERVEKAAKFLCEIADALSRVAYNHYMALQTSRKHERAAKSQKDFIVDLNTNMQQHLKQWLHTSKEAMEQQDREKMETLLQSIVKKGNELVSLLGDTVAYSKMTDGTIELNETEYNIERLIRHIWTRIQNDINYSGTEFGLHIAEGVPEVLLGDEGHLGQILTKLFQNILHERMENKRIEIDVSCEDKTYCKILYVSIQDSGTVLSDMERKSFINYFRDKENQPMIERKEATELDVSIINFLLKQMSGTLSVVNKEREGTIFTIAVPQLEVR